MPSLHDTRTEGEGILVATGGNAGAGIGGGYWNSGGTITISGGTVTAIGGGNGAGIGGGQFGTGGTITISGGTVTATGGGYSAGIGGGGGNSTTYGGNGGNITINGGDVTAASGGYGAGIGGGFWGAGGTITISDGVVTATASNSTGDPAGIGGGGFGGNYNSTITITGGIVTATGSQKGIGNGTYNTGGSITIAGGTVIANGIGTGNGESMTTTISGNGFIICTDVTYGGINQGNKTSWSGVIFEDDLGVVYGSPITLTTDAEIPQGKTLKTESGKTLTVGSGATLTNRGTITVDSGGTLEIENGGIFNNYGTLNGSGIKPGDADINTKNSAVTLIASSAELAYGDNITLTATITEKTKLISPRGAVSKSVVFYCDGEEIGSAIVTDFGGAKKATLNLKLNTDIWTGGNHNITAKYVGGFQLLPSESNPVSLTVKKATNIIINTPTSATVQMNSDNKTTDVTIATVSGQKYGYTTNDSTPSTGTGNWRLATGDNLTFGKLAANQALYFWTYQPANSYYEESTVSSSLLVTTKVVPTIATTSLPGAGLNVEYFQALAAIGTQTIIWSVNSGNLPKGLSLDQSNGVISGIPAATGTASFTVKASNGYGTDATQVLSIEVTNAAPMGDFTVMPTNEGETIAAGDYSYADHALTIHSSKAITIGMKNGTTSTDKIVVATGVTANITLDNVGIGFADGGEVGYGAYPNNAGTTALAVGTNATLNLDLSGTNTIQSGSGRAGIYVPEGATLNIDGDGSLEVTSGQSGAAIGSDVWSNAGTINIKGGTITATAAAGGTAIGGGHSNDNAANMYGGFAAINITGGKIQATACSSGGSNAAAIGTGCWSKKSEGTIRIEDATVYAETNGDHQNCAAIGRGIVPNNAPPTVAEITITNSVVRAKNVTNKGPAINKDINGTANWSGFVYENDSPTLYGSAFTLSEDAEIPAGKTLTIAAGQTLTIAKGTTLTCNGDITNSGTIKNYGTIVGWPKDGGTHGDVHQPGKVAVSFQKNDRDVSAAGYGDTVKITATMSKKETTKSMRSVAADKVEFYLGGVEGTKLGTRDVTESDGKITASIEVALTSDEWKPNDSPYTITADFGGFATGELLEGVGTGTLTVGKGEQSATTVDVIPTNPTYGGTAPTITPVTVQNNANVTYSAVSNTSGSDDSSSVASISSTTITLNSAGNFYVKAVIAATDYYTAKTIYSNEITVGSADSDFTVTVKKGDTATNAFTYGDTITVEVNSIGLKTTRSIDKNKVYLYAVDPNANQNAAAIASADVNSASATLTYDTTGKAIEAGDNKSIYVVYGGSGNLKQVTKEVTVNLAKQAQATPTAYIMPTTVTINENGGTGASGAGSYAQGATVTLTAGSKSGYSFSSWTLTGATTTGTSGKNITFTMPAGNVTAAINWTYTGGGSSSGGSSGGNDSTPAPTPTAKESYTVSGGTVAVSRGDLQILANSGKSLSINNDTATMTFDSAALKAILNATSGTVTFGMVPADISQFTEAKALIGDRPVLNFTISQQSGGENVVVPINFGSGSVAVQIKYTPTAAEQNGGLYIAYVDSKGNTTMVTTSGYDANKKAVIFSAGHFSTYSVAYKADIPKFTDTSTHWAKMDIEFVAARGLLNGTSATMFSPNTSMTRGMFVTALGRLAGVDPNSYKTGSFTDVKADAYYAAYVNWAVQNNIVTGWGATTFAPDSAITRQEMAVMTANYAKAIGYKLPSVHKEIIFTDSASVGSWAKTAVKEMQMAGILMGKDGGKFDPTGTATRAEGSAMLRRFVELVANSETAEGWVTNDSGNWMYFEDGKAVTGKKKIDGTTYEFDQYGVTAILPKDRRFTLYTVQKGDSFWAIASKYKVNIFELVALNGKNIFSTIHPGDELKIPQE